MTSLLVKSVAALAVSASMSYAGVSGKGVVPPPPPSAPEPAALFDTIGADLSVGYDTRYYNRGIWMTDDAVWTKLNIAVPLTETIGFNFGAKYLDNFNNAPGNVAPGVYDFSQLDLFAGLSIDVGVGTFGVNFTQNFFPNSFGGTTAGVATAGASDEFGITSASELGLTFATAFYGFNWDIGYYYNFRIGGSYYETNLSYEIAVTPWMSLVPAFQAGFSNDYFSAVSPNVGIGLGARSSGWSHFAFSLSAPIALTPTTTLKPYISWISTATTTNYLAGNASANNEIFGGVSLSVSF